MGSRAVGVKGVGVRGGGEVQGRQGLRVVAPVVEVARLKTLGRIQRSIINVILMLLKTAIQLSFSSVAKEKLESGHHVFKVD